MKTIDFSQVFSQEESKVENNQAVAESVQPNSNVITATSVADTAVAVAETVVPGVSAAPINETESTVLNIEDSIRKVFSVIPAASSLSGFVLPAEIVTHLGFAFYHLLSHHVKTVQAATTNK
jgi:hypothetical protein